MQQRLAPEASEDRFRKFSAELLAAEEVGFRGGFFYSPAALRKILNRFCDIIAENLNVQSCTIQLKLYDSSNSPLLKRLLDSGKLPGTTQIGSIMSCSPDQRALWENFSSKCKDRYDVVVSNNGKFNEHQIKFRKMLLKNSIIFPYALYPKGALWLAASNRKGPWAKCAPWLITEISRGIMTQIIQDKAARVRDRMSLRQTRSQRKLGFLDPHIWTNRLWPLNTDDQPTPHYFFNYYGVPILIHQGGDVIGILRVENKGLGAVKRTALEEPNAAAHQALHQFLQIPIGENANCDQIAETLLTNLREYKNKIADSDELEPRDISLLSLIYLAQDFATAQRKPDQIIGDLCTLPYPDSKAAQIVPIESAGDEDSRPPVQITFDNSEEERAFVNWLSGTDKEDPQRFEAAKIFYRTLNTELSGRLTDNVNNDIERTLLHAITAAIQPGTDLSHLEIKAEEIESISFLRTIQLHIPDEVRFIFHLQVSPTQRELNEVNLTSWRLKKDGRDFSPRSADWDFDLPTDRLAARIEALTSAFPIPKFTVSDAWWLSWAALEIGKLIERQISYRGTNIAPTVPLTAMDFFRVPISDLGFVDALRSQYKAAETVKGMLEYHIPNHCRELALEVTLEHNCRIKDFRSYLERLGQEHRAYYDALTATWLHALYSSIDPEIEDHLSLAIQNHKEKCKEHYLRQGLEEHFSNLRHCETLYAQAISVVNKLKSFDDALKAICEGQSVLLTEKEAEWLRNSGPTVFGDLKFAAPDIELAKEDREAACALILKNLRCSPQSARGPSDVGRTELMDEKEIIEYVLRRYDPFVTHGISLYILLTNAIQDKEGSGYRDFYTKCRALTEHLRKKFEASYQSHEQWRDATELISATKRLIDELGSLRARVTELSTSDFSSVLQTAYMDILGHKKERGKDACLSLEGIYKRIRTLINISGNQACPTLLNWETSRFDYVGARINCLFKNQVFAIYEHLWNRGDPFSHWTIDTVEDVGEPQTEGSKHAPARGGNPTSKDEASRQRWLSIQTKIHRGGDGYNAWQMSALMDPRAAFKGHWSSSLYTIKALRYYLVLAFDRWHKESAIAYRKLANDRSKLQEEYCQWFSRGYITHVLRKDAIAAETEVEQEEIYFPEYLLRTPLDIFIRLLETDLVRKSDFQEILQSLMDFVGKCSVSNDPETLWVHAKQIYDKARDLAKKNYSQTTRTEKGTESSLSGFDLIELENALAGQLPVLDQEEDRFSRILDEDENRSSKLAKWPDLTAFQDDTLAKRLKAMKDILEASDDVTEIWSKGMRHVLVELQSMQKEFLFEIGDVREPKNILERILCYLLLFDPQLGDKRCRDIFKNWSAHDLFYYLTSLVPTEIQVRTTLADTMAEQYHGVYKSNVNPAHSVAVQRKRLQEMGRKLDDLDRETEAIYDGYIVHSVLHARRLKYRQDDEDYG